MPNHDDELSPEMRRNVARLFDAAKRGDLPLVKELIAEGVDVDRLDVTDEFGFPGQDPVDVAADYGHGDVIRELVGAGSNNRAFVVNAIHSRQSDAVRAWLELGLDVNEPTDEDGYTPLLAAANSTVEIVRALVDAGAKVNYMSPDGNTALGLALRAGNREIAEFLRPLSSPPVIRQAERYAREA